ncbi:MAG: hypothetical protein IJO34_06425, partial [Akkermansia sp.]|nr:hypothetical protein [Akkermansia sp.]
PFEPPRDGVRGKLYMNRLKTSSLFLKKMQIFVKKRPKKPIFCSFEPQIWPFWGKYALSYRKSPKK